MPQAVRFVHFFKSIAFMGVLVGSACSSDPEPAPAPAPAPAPEAPPPAVDSGGPEGSARPRITKLLATPGRPDTLSHIRLEVAAEDPDGGPVTVRYQWFKNGEKQLHLVRDSVPAAQSERGDVWMCEVLAIDRDGEETMRKTQEIEVVNAPPTFTTDPRSVTELDGLQLKATDPDGDDLTFTLSGAPRGMTIDKRRGVLRYEGNKDEPGGHYELVAKVDDGHSGKATWTFGIDVTPGSGAASADAGNGRAKAKAPAAGGDPKPEGRERRRTAW